MNKSNLDTEHSEYTRKIYNEFEQLVDVRNTEKGFNYSMRTDLSGASVNISIHEAHPFVKIALLRMYFEQSDDETVLSE